MCAVFTALVSVSLETFSTPGTVKEWVGALLLFPGYSSAIIFVGWTLAYEVFFYLVFAALLAFRLDIRNTLLILTSVFFGLIAVGQIWSFEDDGFIQVATSVLLVEFLLGAWIAYYIIVVKSKNVVAGITFLTAGIVAFALGLIVGYDKVPHVISWGLPSASIVLGAVLIERASGVSTFFQRYAVLGDASYGLYLIHPAIISIIFYPLVERGAFGDFSFGVLLSISLFLNILASILLNRYIEPKLRWHRKMS